jgi:carnitine-CoA ligase
MTDTIPDLLDARASDHPGRRVLSIGERALTYGELANRTVRLAWGLAELGIERGQTLGAMVPNSIEWIESWLAAGRVGAIAAGVNPTHTGDRLKQALAVGNVSVLVLRADQLDAVGPLLPELPQLRHLVVADGGGEGMGVQEIDVLIEVHRYNDLLSASARKLDAARPEDASMLVFTSGTTGPAKAVEATHTYHLHMAHEIIEHLELTASDVLYSAFPLYHDDASISTFLAAVVAGGGAAFSVKFSASRFWDEVRAHGATVMTFVGASLLILSKKPRDADDRRHSVRLGWGAPMPPNWAEFEERFGLRLVEAYGTTECCNVAWDPLDQPHREGACGRISGHHEVRIVGTDAADVPPGTSGEIVVRAKDTAHQMTGYFGNQEATAAARPGAWYHTGDLGHMDADGWLYFEGRIRDSIRRRGENISAYEIESVLGVDPRVLECAAFAVPSELSEDEIKVVVVCVPGGSVGAQEIADTAASTLPSHMVPRFVEVVTSLPKTETDKVLKRELQSEWRTPGTFDTERKVYLT